MSNGLTLSPLGEIYVTTTIPGAGSSSCNGLAFSTTGQLHVTQTLSSSDTYIGGRRISALGQLVVGNAQPPFVYNAGLPTNNPGIGFEVARQLDQIPISTDPYVAGVRVGPLGGVYMLTAAVPS